jgi:hypothetical protein
MLMAARSPAIESRASSLEAAYRVAPIRSRHSTSQ